jgi:hypothetical protein
VVAATSVPRADLDRNDSADRRPGRDHLVASRLEHTRRRVGPPLRSPLTPERPSGFAPAHRGERLAVSSFPLVPTSWPDSLSDAERAVVRAVIAGASNSQVAALCENPSVRD